MSELVIQQHNFENAKEEIKKFSEQTTTYLGLKKVDDTKSVGEFLGDWVFGRGIGLNHKVTGEELNELTTQMQTHLHSINNTQIKLIKEFGQVYSALEALDKDYIQAILVSIKATEETSQSIQKTQEQIKRIVENQRKTLEELKKFKNKLDDYAHLGDIDEIWSEYQRWEKEKNALCKSIGNVTKESKESIEKVNAVTAAVTAVEKEIEVLSFQASNMIEKLESVIDFTTALEQVIHLKDIDEMWESLSSAHDFIRNISGEVDDIRKQMVDYWSHIKKLEQTGEIHASKLEELTQADVWIEKRIESNKDEIYRLREYKEKLNSMTHLEEVDGIWENVENHTSQLNEFEKRDEELAVAIQKNRDEVDKKIADVVQTANTAVESLTKRIKYAYLIAGGSAGLAILELILLLMKVI